MTKELLYDGYSSETQVAHHSQVFQKRREDKTHPKCQRWFTRWCLPSLDMKNDLSERSLTDTKSKFWMHYRRVTFLPPRRMQMGFFWVERVCQPLLMLLVSCSSEGVASHEIPPLRHQERSLEGTHIAASEGCAFKYWSQCSNGFLEALQTSAQGKRQVLANPGITWHNMTSRIWSVISSKAFLFS